VLRKNLISKPLTDIYIHKECEKESAFLSMCPCSFSAVYFKKKWTIAPK